MVDQGGHYAGSRGSTKVDQGDPLWWVKGGATMVDQGGPLW